MDTIIDTRTFPKEMQEQPPKEQRKTGAWKSFLLWILFVLVIAGIVFYVWKGWNRKSELVPGRDLERENAVAESLLKASTRPLPEEVHDEMIQGFFQG